MRIPQNAARSGLTVRRVGAGSARVALAVPLFLLALWLCGCPSRHGAFTEALPLDQQLDLFALELPPRAPDLVLLTNELLSAPPQDDRLVRALAAAEAAVAAAPGYATRWRAARAASYVAQYHSSHTVRLAAVQRGIDHARAAREVEPARPGGYHFGAANLGLMAQLEPEGALPRLTELVRLAERARELDDRFEQGGPLRVLGAVYTQAPPWPTSVGDVEEAVYVLAELVERFPAYPLNHFLYGEALMKMSEYDRAAEQFEATLRAAPRNIWRLEGPAFRALARQRLADIQRLKSLQ